MSSWGKKKWTAEHWTCQQTMWVRMARAISTAALTTTASQGGSSTEDIQLSQQEREEEENDDDQVEDVGSWGHTDDVELGEEPKPDDVAPHFTEQWKVKVVITMKENTRKRCEQVLFIHMWIESTRSSQHLMPKLPAWRSVVPELKLCTQRASSHWIQIYSGFLQVNIKWTRLFEAQTRVAFLWWLSQVVVAFAPIFLRNQVLLHPHSWRTPPCCPLYFRDNRESGAIQITLGVVIRGPSYEKPHLKCLSPWFGNRRDFTCFVVVGKSAKIKSSCLRHQKYAWQWSVKRLKDPVNSSHFDNSSIRARYLVHTWRFFFIFCQKFGSDCASSLLPMIYRVKLGRYISFAF